MGTERLIQRPWSASLPVRNRSYRRKILECASPLALWELSVVNKPTTLTTCRSLVCQPDATRFALTNDRHYCYCQVRGIDNISPSASPLQLN